MIRTYKADDRESSFSYGVWAHIMAPKQYIGRQYTTTHPGSAPDSFCRLLHGACSSLVARAGQTGYADGVCGCQSGGELAASCESVSLCL